MLTSTRKMSKWNFSATPHPPKREQIHQEKYLKWKLPPKWGVGRKDWDYIWQNTSYSTPWAVSNFLHKIHWHHKHSNFTACSICCLCALDNTFCRPWIHPQHFPLVGHITPTSAQGLESKPINCSILPWTCPVY